MRIRSAILGFLGALLLSGCGPVYKTTYHFTPPDSQRGRECVNACQSTQQQCESNENYTYEQCKNRAERSYQACESRKKFEPHPKKGWKEPKCVENCQDCSRPYCSSPDDDKCAERYRECYRTCGGSIEKTVTCTSNCDAK